MLLSVGLLAVITASRAARDSQTRAVYMAQGRALAQSKLDAARTASFDGIPDLACNTSDSSLPAGNSVKIAVARYPNNSVSHCYRIQVTVSWPESKGTRTIFYETLVTRK